MLLGKQVWALILKDVHVARANLKASISEVLFPIFMGSLCGLFMLLVQIVQNRENENSNTTPVIIQTKDVWVGVVSPLPLNALMVAFSAALRLWAPSVIVETFATTEEMTAANYALNRSRFREQIGFAPGPKKDVDSWQIYYSFNHSDGMRTSVGAAHILYTNQVMSAVESPANVDINYAPMGITVNLRAVFSSSGMMFLIYAFIPALILTGGRLVEEKANKIRESLKVMGLSDTAYLLSNFITSGVRMGIGTGMIAGCLAAFQAIDVDDMPKVCGYALLFACSLIAFAQIMPSLFSVSIWSNVLCIVLLGSGAALSSLSTGWDHGMQQMTCLISPVAFFYAVLPSMSGDTVILHVSPSEAAVMLIVDTVIYLAIGNYIYAVNPGEFGLPKHPLFFIRWIWHHHTRAKAADDAGEQGEKVKNDQYRVILKKLSKYYGSQRHTPSVDELSLSIKRGEIFALLGHNGAGKTTTISMLTGLTTATSYDEASVDGFDIESQMNEIRAMIGLCPQFDVLFNDLTARQHLELFAAIKDIKNPKGKIDALMKNLDLPDTTQRCVTFSGGTKRRMSVGNAMVGGASLIFLDEPSSGMDPLSRRQMWDMLKEEREKGTTIVLTTHFMEEADYLGDRIAIMSHGRLYCCDTSQHLKERYGVGYYVTLVKSHESQMTPDVEAMTSLITRHVPETVLHHDSSGDATFLLPIQALSKFGELLTEIESVLTQKGFSSYGVSMNTLEDVFVSISEKEEEAAHQPEVHDAGHIQGGNLQEDKPHRSEEHGEHAAHVQLNTATVDGEDVEAIFQRGMNISYWARVRSQTWSIFCRKMTMFLRSMRMKTMVIGFPIFFIVIAFLAIQPQQAKGTEKGFEGGKEPEYDSLNIVFVDLRDHDDNAKVLAEFKKLYNISYPNSTLKVFLMDNYNTYAAGNYMPLRSVSFIDGFNTPTVPCGFIAHSADLFGKRGGHAFANYTLLFDFDYNPGFAFEMSSMIQQAIERAAHGNLSNVVVTPKHFKVSETETPKPTEASEPENRTYNLVQVGIYFVISVVQLVASCVIPVADELQRGVYHTTRSHGMTSAAYFIANILFDLLCLVVPFGVFTVCLFAKHVGAFYGPILFWTLLAALLFSIHTILQAYIFVTYVSGLKPVTYTGLLHGVNLALLALPYLSTVILNSIGFKYAKDLKPYILSITPPAAFFSIMDNASDLTKENTRASYILTFTGIGTGWGFVFLVVEMALPIYLVIRFAQDRVALKAPAPEQEPGGASLSAAAGEKQPLLAAPQKAPVTVKHEDEDPDVKKERDRVEQGKDEESMVYTLNLSRTFGAHSSLKVAVNDVSFGIRKGECFGLLGPNGAGKTTTCNLMLKQLHPTGGDVIYPFVGVHLAETEIDEAYRRCRLGVCPQGNSLWEYLTAAEHMDQYLRMRLTTEYDPAKWKDFIRDTILKVRLEKVDTRLAGEYSGGMKRKLLVCLAMYTGGLTVFLDEPSTGMDPFARRALWQVILEAISHNHCILLTTHSMEEADAVCSRIGIIADGSMRCIGSSQHLKNRFGSGYVLTAVLNSDSAEAGSRLDAAVSRHFAESRLLEALGNTRRYNIGNLSSLAGAFKVVEEQRKPLDIAQYSISQTSSLEQIFLNFVGAAGREE